MARRGRGPSISQRATSRVSRPPVSPRPRYAVQVYPTRKIVKIDYRLYEDRRNWHPMGKLHSAGVIGPRDARRIEDHYRRTVLRKRGLLDHLNPFGRFEGWLPASRQAFKFPDRVLVCVRRQQRRQVLFALRGTGKGSRKKERKFNAFSEISCKRK